MGEILFAVASLGLVCFFAGIGFGFQYGLRRGREIWRPAPAAPKEGSDAALELAKGLFSDSVHTVWSQHEIMDALEVLRKQVAGGDAAKAERT